MSVTASTPAVRTFCITRSAKMVSRPRVVMAVGSNTISGASILTKLQKDCATPLPVLRHVADAMADDMRAGLAVEGGSELQMILSYVDALPTGNEKGLFYALDLGGTNFRVLRVQLGGKEERVISTEFEQVSIPPELMFGTSEELFDFIASVLAKFALKEGGKFHLQQGRTREIGFTFSFPVKQTSIDSGILIKWTKGFAVSGTAGKDVVACLNGAMKRQKLDMRVSALVNDTVGTLAGARYWDNDVMVAVILGTGTNACYVERVDAIPKFQDPSSTSGRTIVNTEWGAFSNGLPLTEFDREMDAESINPREQIFEKTISGMYLGEIVRRVLLRMAEAAHLFGHSVPEKLLMPFSLRTPDICAMQQDTSKDLEEVGSILYDVAGVNSSTNARKIVIDVCDTIAKRGGRLAGAGIVGILQKMEYDSKGLIFGKRTVVAMDGGLYEHYPQYRRYLQEAVTELLGPEISRNIVIEHSKDGSGIGAALLAATNSKYEHDF
ncbi:hexokinase-2, chloroplastic [Olea europaea var. sylvestris]|uniref:hexokinase-2, chloroplastic n=1 Tax=Olea europaea var. sylvestris TaxID=158386 RepID=UPI000C1D1593|nr:hexokinase-2, chloroplastic [Olea europaea var. sylvestris]